MTGGALPPQPGAHLAQTAHPTIAQPVPMRQRLVNARLLTLLRLARTSGDLAYQRYLGLTEMHRRLITLVGNFDGLSSAGLVRLMGSDKAQVSRAVKALTAAGLITRASLRADVRLTDRGAALFEQMMEIGRDRDAAIAKGVGKAELERFRTLTAELTYRAALLLAHERQLSGEAGEETEEAEEPSRAQFPSIADQLGEERERPLSRMIVPAALTLVSYLQRSATVAYKRETGVSQFEWRILSHSAEHHPITLAELIGLTNRDNSHIGRTLRRLADAGLVSPQRVVGRRETVLTPTCQGAEVYDRMCTIAVRRDDFLFAEAKPGTKDAYVATIEKLTANAEAMLRDERSHG